jgi:hypothetical protein
MTPPYWNPEVTKDAIDLRRDIMERFMATTYYGEPTAMAARANFNVPPHRKPPARLNSTWRTRPLVDNSACDGAAIQWGMSSCLCTPKINADDEKAGGAGGAGEV